MEHFVIKLKPSREGFMFSMTPEERQVMQSHAVYWAGLMDQGVAVVYGPVNDPEGSYGLGVIAVEDAAAVDMIRRADPGGLSRRADATGALQGSHDLSRYQCRLPSTARRPVIFRSASSPLTAHNRAT